MRSIPTIPTCPRRWQFVPVNLLLLLLLLLPLLNPQPPAMARPPPTEGMTEEEEKRLPLLINFSWRERNFCENVAFWDRFSTHMLQGNVKVVARANKTTERIAMYSNLINLVVAVRKFSLIEIAIELESNFGRKGQLSVLGLLSLLQFLERK